ncbi:MAG: proton-conducting transporter transmembrane domain-containing protein [Gemmatimonadaceae bacterium]
MSIGALLLASVGALVLAVVAGRGAPRAWLALTILGAAAALVAAVVVLFGGADWEWRSAVRLGGEALHLRLDGVSALFLALVGVIGGAGAIYAREYWPEEHHAASAPRGRAWWSALVLSMILVLTASNGLHFLIAWESFAIAAYFLITLDRQRRAVRSAGWLYLAASHAGTMALFAFFTLLAVRTGSWELGPMRDHASLQPLFWLALAGFGVKAGLFPLHVWLPSAHANAPSHVSAIMSGVAIKMGVYGIVRFSGWLPVPSAAGWVLTGLGAVSAVVGIAFAFAQQDLKRLLAYCSVENVGIIMVGLGGALLAVGDGGAPWGRLLLAGALLHVWNHGLFKSLLFLGAGSVLHATGTKEMSRLGGLWRRLPWTAGLFALGSLAVAALPPLNGFVSEWLVYLGLFDAVTSRSASAWPAMLAAIMLGIAGALALASFLKAGALVFLGAPRTQPAARAHESGWTMRGPMAALAALCLALGLAPTVVWPALARAVGSWQPAWAGTDVLVPLRAIGGTQLSLAALVVLAGWGTWRLTQHRGVRRGMTWDCGYAMPTARMQYSSGSFAQIVVGWFRWLLRPRLLLRRPRGLAPVRSFRLERVPDTVLDVVIAPLGGAIMQLASGARRLQHGSLQAYIMYLVAGLVALGAMVLGTGVR